MSKAARPPKTLPTIRSILARGHLRLALMAVLLAASTLTVSGALLLRGYARVNLELSARTLRHAVEPAVYFGDSDALQDAIDSVVSAGDLRRVQILAADGAPIMTWQPDNAADPGIVAQMFSIFSPDEVELPIVAATGETIGMVRVTASLDRLMRYALSGVIICICSVGLTILATRIVTRRLEEEVVQPIEHIARIAMEVRGKRDFSLRVNPSPIAEVDRFSNDFNALLVELQSWHEGFLSENRTLAHLAEHDPLTGLGNRLLFDRELQGAMELAQASGGSFTLLFIDLNGFKPVNDMHGHLVGDALLAEVAQRIRDTLRARDQAFRLGGDEFAVLADPLASGVDGQAMAARIREAMACPAALPHASGGAGLHLPISVSIGLASYPADGDNAGSLIGHADTQMYADKKEARLHANRR